MSSRMSSKTRPLSQTRIVNTNSSGIVTIVIDDDSDVDSNAPKVTNSVISSRPAMEVIAPVMTQTPKFVSHCSQNNQQKVVIQENKNNVILVTNSSPNSSHNPQIINGSCFGSSSCSSSSSRVSCIASQASQALPSEVKSQHNHVSKSQTHYVVVNKPMKQLSHTTHTQNTPNSTITSCVTTSSSSSSKPCSSPTKYRLWQSNQSFSRSPPIRPSVRVRERVLPPEDTESDCMDDQTFFKYLNLIPANEYRNKSKIDLNMNWPLRKVNKIIRPETSTQGNILLPNFKLIRTTLTSTPDMTQMFNERKIQWYREAQLYNEKLQKFKANLPTNTSVRDKMQTDLEQLHQRLMAEKQRQNEEEEKYRKTKNIEHRKRLQQDEQKQEFELYMNSFEWTSLMGQRVRDSASDNRLTAQQIYYKNCKIEEFCAHKDIHSVTAPQTTKLSTRITRSNTGFAGIDRMWGPRSESHEYCFSRKQRLEKYKRLETGLNWKSRIIAMQCKRVDVEVSKITRCPCCLELVEPEWGHSCRDSDCDSNQVEIMSINDSEVGNQSENNFNDEEVMSINSEIITAGNIFCYECGSEDCDGTCLQTPTPVTKISITEPSILVFASNENLLQSKPKIEDKIMVQKVPALQTNNDNNNKRIIDSNNQRIAEQKLRLSNEKIDVMPNYGHDRHDNESDDDIVIVKEVRNDDQCFSQQKSHTEPVIIRFGNPLDPRTSLKRKFSDGKVHSSKITTNSSEIILIKKL